MNNEKEAKVSIITPLEIQEILGDYRIGKKPLSKLLGWGETTIIRYMDGDVPTPEYSEKLKAILNDPGYYYEILMRGRDKLTGVAFRKSRQAVLDKMMESKIYTVAQYIINLCEAQICAADLNYMLYYVQCFHMALYDREVFSDEYRITERIIPYPDLFDKIGRRVPAVVEVKPGLLEETEEAVIKAVIRAFRWYGYETLKAMVSAERTVMRISRDKDNRRIIGKGALMQYFGNVVKEYGIASPRNIGLYPDRRIVDIKNLDL